MSAHGMYTTHDGRPAVAFERRLDHPIEKVWHAVTDPGELAHWFPCEVALDGLRPGAAMTFTFSGHGFEMTGEVVEVDEPRRFAFLWGEDLLRFDLDAADGGTVLRLLHVLDTEGEPSAAKNAAGWHVCLDRLERALTGETAAESSSGPTPEWRELYEAYQAQGVPAGAPVPGAD